MSAQPWPAELAWMTPDTPSLQIAICDRAWKDLAVCETPPGSNRGGRIDEFCRRAGAPLGSYWCMAAATAWWEDAGAIVPTVDRASCQAVMMWAQQNGTWFKSVPALGAMAIYGTPNGNGGWAPNAAGHLAHHVGVVVRILPYMITAEGNAAWSGFSSNGEAVLLKQSEVRRIMGYVHPRSTL